MSGPSRQYRKLNASEVRVARRVFKDTIPYDKIRIGDGSGVGGAVWTQAGVAGLDYVIHGGHRHSVDWSSTKALQRLLVHELTHVWQGEHVGPSYMLESLAHQAWAEATGGSAYAYDAVNYKPWDSYNVEQQADIVEHWFRDGRKPTDPRYRYIRYHIWGEDFAPLDDAPAKSLAYFKVAGSESPLLVPGDVLFAFNSAVLKAEAIEYLKRAHEILRTRSQGRTIVIEGHTDSTGSAAYNLKLSLRRALVVKQWLVRQRFPKPTRLEARGLGESKPLAPNDTIEGRRKNRRVEFRYE
jgi:outer membrane protein OmpA-like peptidoglycan-associated protein